MKILYVKLVACWAARLFMSLYPSARCYFAIVVEMVLLKLLIPFIPHRVFNCFNCLLICHQFIVCYCCEWNHVVNFF